MLTEDQKLEIRRLRADGLTYERIANMVGCSTTAAFDISYDVERTKDHEIEQETRAALRKLKRKLRYIQARMRKGTLKPCEHCRWRRNKEPVPVCVVCYREQFSAAGQKRG